VIRADRYTLTGTTVLDKIDVTDMSAGGRRRRKRRGEEPATAEGETPAPEGGAAAPAEGERTRRARGGKKAAGRRAAVDRAEVEANLQQTLTQLGQGTGRRRQKARRARREERAAEREAEQERIASEAGTLRVLEFLSTGELANAMNVAVAEVISKGFGLGMMVSINQRLDADTITLLADEFGYEVEFVSSEEDDLAIIEEDAPETLQSRAPVVTIMGHVDHGKTSLLDYIRNASVVAGESGGITQHIGAYEVALEDGREITFLDTPGHEAFTAMRARGAQVTDIVVLVVAADDQVMPQTVEAINHAKAAGVPIVVAMNKMDRAEANPDKIMSGLSEQGVLVEQYGGQVQSEPISAKTGMGVPELLEKVLVEAELLELKANPDRDAVGTVIESRLDRGRGVVATVLVQTGTLRVGDAFVAGTQAGRVRAMFDERDQRVEEAGPSQPVQILGFASAPDVGDRLVVMEDEREAREVAGRRVQLHREQAMRARRHISLDELSRRMALGELKELNLVVKGDVAGSVEALSDSLLKITNEEVAVNIVHSGAGAITESDVMLAAASDAIIIGFNVRPMPSARALAEREEIDIRHYSVIYDAIEEVRDALEGLLSPEETEKVTATVEVRDTFRVPKQGTIAGSYVLDGKVRRNDRVRLIRDGVVVYTGNVDSLRRFKEDVREVAAGYECGISIAGFNDIKVGDQIESFEVVETKRQLTV
jgi:translation initiation factor IF-2